MEGIAEVYAKRGIILKPVDVSDLLLYFRLSRRDRSSSKLGDETGRSRVCLRGLATRGFSSRTERNTCSNG